MLKRKWVVNLRLFDGEGEGQSTTDSSSGTSPNGLETSGGTVVYGKSTEEEIPAATEGTSSNTQEQEYTIDFSKITPEKRGDYYKQFKDNFKDEFTNDFQSHFDRRFKGHKEVEGKISKYEPIVESLMKYHGVADIDSLGKLVDEEIMSELAEREGFPSVEKYKEYLDGKKATEVLTKSQQEAAIKQTNEQRINTWVEQGVALKKTYADFDLSKEILNPAFAARLEKTDSVEDAYFLTHKDEILQARAREAAQKAEENTVTSIKSKQNRIPENGLNKTPGVVRKTDPSKLTSKDLEEIRDRVARGERISF